MADPTTHGPKCEEAVVQEADPRQNPCSTLNPPGPSQLLSCCMALLGEALSHALLQKLVILISDLLH